MGEGRGQSARAVGEHRPGHRAQGLPGLAIARASWQRHGARQGPGGQRCEGSSRPLSGAARGTQTLETLTPKPSTLNPTPLIPRPEEGAGLSPLPDRLGVELLLDPGPRLVLHALELSVEGQVVALRQLLEPGQLRAAEAGEGGGRGEGRARAEASRGRWVVALRRLGQEGPRQGRGVGVHMGATWGRGGWVLGGAVGVVGRPWIRSQAGREEGQCQA